MCKDSLPTGSSSSRPEAAACGRAGCQVGTCRLPGLLLPLLLLLLLLLMVLRLLMVLLLVLLLLMWRLVLALILLQDQGRLRQPPTRRSRRVCCWGGLLLHLLLPSPRSAHSSRGHALKTHRRRRVAETPPLFPEPQSLLPRPPTPRIHLRTPRRTR